MAKLWKAKETTVQIADALSPSSISSSTLLDAMSYTNQKPLTALLKNVTIVEPEGAVDKEDFLGTDSNGFQNAELSEKPYDVAKISGTLVMPAIHESGTAMLERWAYGNGTQVPSGSPTHTRWQPGDGNRIACAILVNLVSGSDYEVTILLNQAYITKLGDRKIGGPDGHWEQDFEAVCLPRNYYVEVKGTVTYT